MTAESTVQYRVLRSLESDGFEAASVAIQIEEPHGCVTIWPGVAPQLPNDIHPSLASPIGQVTEKDTICWVEERANTSSLIDLARPMEPGAAASIVADLAEILMALHARGCTHGAINMETVILDLDNQIQVLGAGLRAGSMDADLAACVHLLQELCDQPIPHQDGSAESLTSSLREFISTTDSSEHPFEEHDTTATRPISGHTISLALQPIGVLDEVQHDIGRDETGRGLLDRWSNTSSIDDMTDDRTESVDASELYARSRQTMLERIDSLYAGKDPATRLPDNTACSAIRSLVEQEPLDPLPIPEGLPHGRLTPADDEDERTAEVTASPLEAPDPPTAENDKTNAGFEGFGTRLMMTAVVGMVGATAVLTVVWAALTFFPF